MQPRWSQYGASGLRTVVLAAHLAVLWTAPSVGDVRRTDGPPDHLLAEQSVALTAAFAFPTKPATGRSEVEVVVVRGEIPILPRQSFEAAESRCCSGVSSLTLQLVYSLTTTSDL